MTTLKLNDKKAFKIKIAVLILGISLITVAALLIVGLKPNGSIEIVDKSWAAENDTITPEGYQYLHDKVKDDPYHQYNYTVDLWENGIKQAADPVAQAQKTLVEIASPRLTWSPDPILGASYIVGMQAKTGSELLGDKAVSEAYLATDTNAVHEAFRGDRDYWMESANNFENCLNNECQCEIIDLGGYSTQTYMVSNRASFDPNAPALAYGQSELMGGKGLKCYNTVTHRTIIYRLTCGGQVIDVTAQDKTIIVEPAHDDKPQCLAKDEPVYHGNSYIGDDQIGGKHNSPTQGKAPDPDPGWDYRQYSGGGTSGGGGGYTPYTPGGGTVNPDNPGQREADPDPYVPPKPGTKDGGDQGEFQ